MKKKQKTKTKTKNDKKKQLRQRKKNKTTRRRRRSNATTSSSASLEPDTILLGLGRDGCVIDSFSCDGFSKDTGYVSKFLFNDKRINIELNDKLKELDPNNERYNRYYLPDTNDCVENAQYRADFKKCSKHGKISTSNMGFQKRLEPMDCTKMTKLQYRHLRKSLEILHENNISHGDLPDNVMLDPVANMPLIIDWEQARLDADNIDKQMDMGAFLEHFKVAKKTE